MASYVCARNRSTTRSRLKESFSRAGKGWVNSYSEKELISLFADAGLPLRDHVDLHMPDGDERVYRFGCTDARE